jgi:hypothetical protein
MPEFVYHFVQTVSTTVVVDAESWEAGEEEAWDKLPGGLCHHCASKVDESGDWELEPEDFE